MLSCCFRCPSNTNYNRTSSNMRNRKPRLHVVELPARSINLCPCLFLCLSHTHTHSLLCFSHFPHISGVSLSLSVNQPEWLSLSLSWYPVSFSHSLSIMPSSRTHLHLELAAARSCSTPTVAGTYFLPENSMFSIQLVPDIVLHINSCDTT